MKLSDLAGQHLQRRSVAPGLDGVHAGRNARKKLAYWIGFLEGVLASSRIEDGEEEALLAEADRFATFLNDASAMSMARELRAIRLSSEDDLVGILQSVVRAKRSELSASAPTGRQDEIDEMNEFLGFCAGVICDGRVLRPEVEAIFARLDRSENLVGQAALGGLRQHLDLVRSKGAWDAETSEETRAEIAQLVGDGHADTGVANLGIAARLNSPIVDSGEVVFARRRFVLTGAMKMGSRSMIAAAIERAGGVWADTVTWDTTYVVVSTEASRHWLTTHFGGKIKKAKELIDKGASIAFVSENALESALRQSGSLD